MHHKVLVLLPLLVLPACATLVNGSSQNVTVSTTPPGASCTLDRIGARLGAITPTPGSVRVDKSKNDLTVTCSKEGFQTATVTHSPHFSGATFGNIIAGGVIGVVVDASTGANYTYPDNVEVALASNGTPLTRISAPQSIVLKPQTAAEGAGITPVMAQSMQPAMPKPMAQ